MLLKLVAITIASLSNLSLGAFSPIGGAPLRISPNSAFRVLTPSSVVIRENESNTPVVFLRTVVEAPKAASTYQPHVVTGFPFAGPSATGGFYGTSATALSTSPVTPIPAQSQGFMATSQPEALTFHSSPIESASSAVAEETVADPTGPSTRKRRRVMKNPEFVYY